MNKYLALSPKIIDELLRASPYKVVIRPCRYSDRTHGISVSVTSNGHGSTYTGASTPAEGQARALQILREKIRNQKYRELREKLINEEQHKAIGRVDAKLAKERRKR